MKSLSEREQLILKALDSKTLVPLESFLEHTDGDFSEKVLTSSTALLSVFSDTQLNKLNQNRSEHAAAPLLIDLVEITGARAAQVITPQKGFVFPDENFEATFYTWKSDQGLQEQRKNRTLSSEYIICPALTFVQTAK